MNRIVVLLNPLKEQFINNTLALAQGDPILYPETGAMPSSLTYRDLDYNLMDNIPPSEDDPDSDIYRYVQVAVTP